MANLTKFFNALSERAYKENDLSDVTYALLMADEKFRQFFLDFFFHDAYLDARHVTIKREHSDQNGRPDFWIETDKGCLYIVEVKIWDGNHHFEDYHGILTKNVLGDDEKKHAWKRLGYIANYNAIKDVKVDNAPVKDLGCRVHTWKEFFDGLEKYRCFDDAAIEAYTRYVRNVCPFDDFAVGKEWTINTQDFIEIKNFDKAIKDAIISHVDCKIYSTPRRFRSQCWMGRFFEWTICGMGALSSKKVWGWLGAKYTQKGAVVGIEIEDRPGWGDVVCKQYRKDLQNGVLAIYSKDSGSIATDVERLKEFFGEVLNLIKNGEKFSEIRERFFTCLSDASEAKLSEPLLAMKCLPFALENHFVTDEFRQAISKAGYDFAFVSGSDEEVSESHCGRYFELRKTLRSEPIAPEPDDGSNKGTEFVQKVAPYRGWIGVDYNASCKRLESGGEGESYGKMPAFIIELPKDFPEAASIKNENTWGWKCIELHNGQAWNTAFDEARKKLLKLFENGLPMAKICQV